MLRFAKVDTGRGSVPDTAAGRKDKDIYDRYADSLYRQALLTLEDCALAEQVVSDIVVGECVQAAAAVRGQDPARRMAVSAYWRCMDLAASPARAPGASVRRAADCTGLAGLSVRERGTLGLVVFGGLGYRQVARELRISASDVATLLRAALGKAAVAAQQPGR
jgi:DNA-binding CsgD family transcriptional regulator